MSTVRFEKVFGGQCAFEQVPSPGKFQLREGSFWNDATQKNLLNQLNGQAGSLISSIAVNTSPVTATNPSTAANLMSLALPAGYTSVAGKTLYVWGAGAYTTAGGQTPTLNIAINIGALSNVVTWTSTATTASVTKTWNFEAFITTVTAGSSGTYEAHGILDVELGGGAAGSVATSAFNDAITAVSGTLDMTAANTLQVQTTLSSSNASNSVVQRQLYIQVIN